MDLIRFGHKGLDSLLGDEGMGRGVFAEISGPPQSGKTLLMMALAGGVQKAGGTVAWANADTTFNGRFASLCGVDLKALIEIPPASAETTFGIAERLADSVDLLVIDPLSALTSVKEMAQAGFEEDLSKTHYRAVSNGLRTLFSATAGTRTSVFLCSQQRWNPQHGIIAASNDDELAFYSTLRLGARLTRREMGGGSYHSVQIVSSFPHTETVGRSISFFFDPLTGIDLSDNLVGLAFEHGLFTVNEGAWVLSGWGVLSSKEEWMARLRRDPGLKTELENRLESAALL